MADVLFVVSAAVPQTTPEGPRRDYAAIAAALRAATGVHVVDRSCIERSRLARLMARVVGVPVALAWLAFRQRHGRRAILSDGEHIGIPLAFLLKLVGSAVPHVTIGHRLSTPKKRPFFRWLRVHSHMARIALHSRLQYDFALEELGIPANRLALVPYQADTDYWHPSDVPEERLICGAGLEYRDYPTLFAAVERLDVQVVIGAASPWSKRPNTATGAVVPPHVTVGRFDYPTLRQWYARAALVVVPLDDVDNQAGITTILEAMAMGKAVVVTQSRGQTDVVEDRRTVTRGAETRPRPVSLLRLIAERQGMELEPNGFYVPPGDAAALERAITYLLDHPEERAALGAAGRRAVERLLTVDQFAARLCALVDRACLPPASEQLSPHYGLEAVLV